VGECVACATRLERERRLRGALAAHLAPFRAPDELRSQVRAALRAEAPYVASRAEVARAEAPRAERPRADVPEREPPRPAAPPARRRVLPWWAGMAAALVIGVAGGWVLRSGAPQAGGDAVATQIVASHIRSLQPGHLADVASSEHHTVKPWFNGRLDYSPPVPDCEAEGFPLLGGRLDYVNQRPVAALTYGRRQHVINLFVWPDSLAGDASPRVERGYNLRHWSARGMTFWAVSDLNGAELDQFVAAVQRQSA
jgi:anti-sigma factor RsiW